jgi:hypothetical protein
MRALEHMSQVPESVRSRLLPEPKTSEATEYMEKCLQVCTSRKTRAEYQKLSAQENMEKVGA